MDPARPSAPAPPPPGGPVYAAWAHPGADLVVDSGANAGDALPHPADSVPGDYYRLRQGAGAARLPT